MHTFDPNQLTYEIVQLKSCTTALGGSVTVVDEVKTNKNGNVKDEFTRIPVPYSVARRFKKLHKTTTYIKPVQAAIVYYNGRAISVERHPFTSDESQWVPNVRRNVNDLKSKLNSGWLFDGQYAYTFSPNIEEQAANAKWLSSDGRFRLIEVDAIDLYKTDQRSVFNDDGSISTRQSVVMMVNGVPYPTPPIWKDNAVHIRAKYEKGEDGKMYEDTSHYPMDKLDQWYATNVTFALKAGKEVSEHFGYRSIEPLQIPELMHRLNTVNLPSVATSVKNTFDIGMPPTQAFAWVLGKLYQADSFQAIDDMRGLLKHLVTRGIFIKGTLKTDNVFTGNHTLHTVPFKKRETAEEMSSQIDLEIG